MASTSAVPIPRLLVLLCAVITTVLAIVAAVDGWGAWSPYLVSAAMTFSVAYISASHRDQIATRIDTLEATIAAYGQERHGDGVLDGMRRAATADIKRIH